MGSPSIKQSHTLAPEFAGLLAAHRYAHGNITSRRGGDKGEIGAGGMPRYRDPLRVAAEPCGVAADPVISKADLGHDFRQLRCRRQGIVHRDKSAARVREGGRGKSGIFLARFLPEPTVDKDVDRRWSVAAHGGKNNEPLPRPWAVRKFELTLPVQRPFWRPGVALASIQNV